MRIRYHAALALVALTAVSCGGDSYSNPTAPGGSTGGDIGATITIRADGTLQPVEVSIAVGQRVRFINQDTRQHQPTSNPHLAHTDCPPANLPIMNANQTMTTGVFGTVQACGFHDHLLPDTTSLYGVIRVGGASGTGGPVY